MLGILVGAGAAAAVAAGYNTMAPRSQLYGRTFIGLPRGRREMALSYDDGPNDPHTFRLLEVLARHNVKATFFMIGQYVARRPDIVQAVVREGHVVGNHTYTHPNIIFKSQAQLRDEITRCEQALTAAVGDQHAPIFRPPFGGRTPGALRTVRELGLTPIMWSITSFDWSAKTSDAIFDKVTREIRGGDVILLHDGGHLQFGADRSRTVIATERLLERYLGEGYAFPTIPQMMSSRLR